MSIVPPSLTQWTEEHLSAIFEATNSQAFNQAFDAFIAPDAVITVNGVKTSVAQYKQQLQGEAFLEASATVKYDGAVEVPDSEKSPTEAGTVGVFYEATFYSELRVFGGAQASTASSSVNVMYVLFDFIY
ncbi:hypothetical protein GLOTRDRAFT_49415 [Gloeophyllum trabeum ATCC 11539]|uniref:NTF2 domain-containing protein n=1 Tax=Gloeophyllum trabeum (strain ATCC 11539 / FP-39264 / Madison 617) TaxID=670483 RepID=S7RF54_GLOTA|nr:uncharacterized protein GLOTRDRAFT_49415 [Gloeophyllum trabeum ATCC 11539]EPQ51124.1 hypothetical protein GLOTRDRAFT_49415 [Gloeophyllum trabeum ATCC 11539]